MTDENSGDPPAWEWREHALIVLPGVSWEEWTGLWSAVERTHKSCQFWTGDALIFGRDSFGEDFASVVDEKYIHQQHGPMWVCSKIPPSRRRPSLSFSLHREVAALDDDEQVLWLDRAEAGRWTVKQLKEEIAAEKARQPGDNGGPAIGEPPTYSEDDERGPPLPLDEPDYDRAEGVVEATPGLVRAPPIFEREDTDEVADVRLLLREVRAIMPDLAADRARVDRVIELSELISDAMGHPAAPVDRSALQCTDEAIKLMPPGWRRLIEGDETGQNWTVTLINGSGLAVGTAPTLAAAICDAALSSLLSDG